MHPNALAQPFELGDQRRVRRPIEIIVHHTP
jgi:hypothetical protein